MSIAEELERLEIIERISSGHYIIQITLDEVDIIFDNDPFYKRQQRSLF